MQIVVLLTAVVLAFTAAAPAAAQSKGGGGLGGVLDTLGGLLGTSQKLRGTVVVARDANLVLRTDDHRTFRFDTAAIDPQIRGALAPGQTVTVVTRGGGGQVLSAAEIQPEGGAPGKAPTFSQVTGTIQEGGENRVLFKTRDGLVLPVDISSIRGLPFFAPDQPATLYYEQGPRQEVVAVWIEPASAGAASASDSSAPSAGVAQPPASRPGATGAGEQRVQGLVESIGMSSFRLQTSAGRTLTVETDPATLRTVQPGDVVTVVGRQGSQPETFVASTVEPEDRRR